MTEKLASSSITIGIIIALLWAIRPALQKYILDSFSFPTVMFVGAVLYFVFVSIFVYVYGHQHVQTELYSMTKKQAGIFLTIAIFGVVGSVLYYKGLSEHPASEIITVTSMWPLLAIVFTSLFLGEKLDPNLLIILFVIVCSLVGFELSKTKSHSKSTV